MYTPKTEKEIRCPLEYGLDVFGGKWKSRIICVLADMQLLRYSELRREMTNITDAVLAATLKELLDDGMIDRKQYNEIPPAGRVLPYRKGTIGRSDSAKHLPLVRRVSQRLRQNEAEPLRAM